ncbi:uncharacterized protein PHACADRAFT_214474 [Phanerochaete carnosa HHB-10118-sp]|uniref:ATP-dependent RNA helicase DBP8 n=1 Tax=Phanerochaete carnosa (strain HHB-10118-sp) TaxID=650164 RepID=K5WG71_PHACS|nr:uncharacterized protein PHACADRAFT_214474 [Phanerochaete carnosa HHB-10118-sp]EKM49202.1 hypothetical protein PHACADRAFT_214474 [Phanerochaete carnosa HHB-10118-sp]
MTNRRRALTTDDLMHMQEDGPARKRRKGELVPGDDGDSDSELKFSPRGTTRWNYEEGSEEESGEDSGSGSDSSEDEDEEDEKDEGSESDSADDTRPPIPNLSDEDDISSSRMSIIPRTLLAIPRKLLTVPVKHSASFAAMSISSPLLAVLNKMSIRAPTEIQAACIPPLFQAEDCIGNAKPGSGKTIAFVLPIIHRLSTDSHGIFALVLTSTRELAFQISEQFAILGAAFNIRTAVVVGGMDIMSQAIELSNRPHIVVTTPGRIVDLLRTDRLLTSTFALELSYLFQAISKERQTCLFTATWMPSIETVADAPPKPGKQKPSVHRMTETVETVATLKQFYILVPSHVRKKAANAVKTVKPTKETKKASAGDEEEVAQPPPPVIFCARPRTAAYLMHLLQHMRIRSTALHSRLMQRERLASLGLFHASIVPVLVCTDVGARGLDIANVALVVNWDLPGAPEEYTYRVGRTARAGRGGVTVSFVTERDEEKVLKIEDRIKTKLREMQMREEKVLEHLNAFSTAKRLANVEFHESDFGKREEIHKIKSAKRKMDVAGS